MLKINVKLTDILGHPDIIRTFGVFSDFRTLIGYKRGRWPPIQTITHGNMELSRPRMADSGSPQQPSQFNCPVREDPPADHAHRSQSQSVHSLGSDGSAGPMRRPRAVSEGRRCRRWVCTSFLPKSHFAGLDMAPFRWFVCGREVCPTTKRVHSQIAFVVRESLTLGSCKRKLQDPAAHFEPMGGTPEQSLRYCTKEDPEAFVYGVCPEQGKRSDLVAVKQSIDEGQSELELWENHFPQMVRYSESFAKYRQCSQPPRSSPPTITVLWGPPGTGKSMSCPAASSTVYWHPLNDNFWSGYSGQTTVVFDEFYGQIRYTDLLRILDRNDYTVPVKGGSRRLSATIFYFTSNKPYTDWYMNVDNTSALDRRMQEYGKIIYKDSLQA